MRWAALSGLLLTFFAGQDGLMGQDVSPLRNAHAHNDYYHKRPLLDALDQGFCSVEADVFLHKDELRVAHTFLEIQKDRTLQSLYLEPLFQRVKTNGYVLAKETPFTLLIDFKSDAGSSLNKLNDLLMPFKNHLTRLESGKLIQGQVTIVISGNRPTRQIVEATDRLVFLDGRLGDPKDWENEISPVVSESWNSHFKYRGFGNMKADEKKKLLSIVQKVHQQEKRIRFWALPDRKKGWQTAWDAGVDLINTDKLESLRKFLLEQRR